MSVLTPKIAGYVNLSYVVALVEMDLEDNSGRNTERFTQWAIHRFTSRAMFKPENVEVVYKTMDADGIIDLSDLTDFVDFVKVGMPVNGKFWNLSVNKKIIHRRTQLSATADALIFTGRGDAMGVDDGYFYSGHYRNGTYINGVFGYGGGMSRAYYNFDAEMMQMQFDSMVPRSEIIIEYVSTGVKATGSTVIPRILVDDLRAYIHWLYKKHDPRVNRLEVREFKQDFIEEENIVDAYLTRFKPDDYYNMMYSTMKPLKR